jgi:hypothetical protein
MLGVFSERLCPHHPIPMQVNVSLTQSRPVKDISLACTAHQSA